MKKWSSLAILAVFFAYLGAAFVPVAISQLTGRIYLTAPIDMYVATVTASPPGTANNPCTVTLPCSSPGAALGRLHRNYDLGGLNPAAIVHVAGGEYNADGPYGDPNTTVPWIQVKGPFVGQSGIGSVQVIGDNPNTVRIRPLSGYCFELQNSAMAYFQKMRCDQDLNTSNPFGPGQDMVSVYGSGTGALLDKIIFGDNGAGVSGTAPFNDITIVNGATVMIQGCPKPTGSNPWTCWIGFDKVAGHSYQAHVLNDRGYFIHNNNNCVDPDPNNICTAYFILGSSAPPTFVGAAAIVINGGVVNWGAFAYSQASSFIGPQYSVRTNGVLFTAGHINGPQPNMDMIGNPHSGYQASGGQVE